MFLGLAAVFLLLLWPILLSFQFLSLPYFGCSCFGALGADEYYFLAFDVAYWDIPKQKRLILFVCLCAYMNL